MPHDALPRAAQPRFDEIVQLVDSVCRTHLTDEYAELTKRLATRTISLNGMIVDVRMLPREMQEQVFALGLIPFVPADIEEVDDAD